MSTISECAKNLRQSGIRNASLQCVRVGGINLGQGICDIPMLSEIQEGAYHAMQQGKNIYSSCQGILPLRQALAKKIKQFNHREVDPETQVIITHGSTGAFMCGIMTIFNPGDEVILFEPFYGYHKSILELYGCTIKTVSINLENLSVDYDELHRVVSKRTKGIIICTPNNPTGKVFSKEELLLIGDFAVKHDLTIITDEIYEYFTYPGHQHFSIASFEPYASRTLTITGFSKTFNMTGWRLGYAFGPDFIIEKMSLLQDLIYVCPSTPLQYGVLQGLQVSPDYYQNLRTEFLHKRDRIVSDLQALGFRLSIPEGAYYLMADISHTRFASGQEAASQLLEYAKVAVVPGESFYANPLDGNSVIRICFALREEILQKAIHQMREIMG